MIPPSIWITGGSRSGKTTRLIELFRQWNQTPISPSEPFQPRLKRLNPQLISPVPLVFAANGDNRLVIADRILARTQGQYAFHSTTPLGFFQDEVILFWPLLTQSLNLKAQFPLRLRPETEQELASELWRHQLDTSQIKRVGVSPERLIRRILDLLQLAGLGGISLDNIPSILEQSSLLPSDSGTLNSEQILQLLHQWRTWCLERGFLTYGLITELYGQHLLPNPTYQHHLKRRYQVVLADDVDEYPAIAYSLFEFFLDQGAVGAFTYNPYGSVRLGLGADPQALSQLQSRCHGETLDDQSGLASRFADPLVDWVIHSAIPVTNPDLRPPTVQLIQTQSRADLLRQTAEAVINAVKSGEAKPQDIAIIGPGIDAIARYTLKQILNHAGIPVESMQEQRPLITSPIIRALLTLLALVYPGNGRLIDRDAVAEMLVILSLQDPLIPVADSQTLDPPQPPLNQGGQEPLLTEIGQEVIAQPPLSKAGQREGQRELEGNSEGILKQPDDSEGENRQPIPAIDAVRAGLLADHCFSPDPDHPQLLPVTAFPRWDRLGYRATAAYNDILQWLTLQREHYQQRLLPTPVTFIDRAIQKFLIRDRLLDVNQLSLLREFMETALHYWEVHSRLKTPADAPGVQVGQFIHLLRRGVITANPYPVSALGTKPDAVTLAPIFQYRLNRLSHRWHFWLDVGSALWLSGGASTLWGAPLFLQENQGQSFTLEDLMATDLQRLHRILVDLLSRVSDRLYLCHSELAANGQEQLGPLLPLVHAI